MLKHIVFLAALFFSISVFAENAETDISMAKITLKTGDVYVGEIIVENEQIVMIRTAEGTRFQFPKNDIESVEKHFVVRIIEVKSAENEFVAESEQIEVSIIKPEELPQTENSIQQRLNRTKTTAHELKFNVLSPITDSVYESSFEYIAGRNIGLGLISNFGVNLGNFNSFGIAPFLRVYSGNHNAGAGLFLESSVAFVHVKRNYFGYSYWDILYSAIGASLGWKYVAKNKLVVELACGIGKIIELHEDDLFLNARLSIGIRL